MHQIIFALLWALVITYLVTFPVLRFARRIGAIDKPEARRAGFELKTRLGGLAIFFGFASAVLLAVNLGEIFGWLGFKLTSVDLSSQFVWGPLLAGAAIVIVGGIDDVIDLRPWQKGIGQLLAAGILVAFGVKWLAFVGPFGINIDFGILAIPITLLWVFGMSTAVNNSDGLDGMAAGVTLISGLTLAAIAWQQGQMGTVLLAAALIGCCAGFLFHNFYPSKIIMGDSGALFLGLALASIGLVGTVKSEVAVAFLLPLVTLGLPILDTLLAYVRRGMSGKPLSAADRGHFHHRLLDKGMTQRQAVLLVYAISAFFGATAVVLTSMSAYLAILIVFGLLVIAWVGAFVVGVLDLAQFRSRGSSAGDGPTDLNRVSVIARVEEG